MWWRGSNSVRKAALAWLVAAGSLFAQADSSPSWTDRLWLSGQANFITQGHPTFTSPYSGPNSLSASAQIVTSRVVTLFSGFRINDTTDFLFDLEETGGNGIGQALGVAGFPNLDVVRNPTLSHNPYIARAILHKMIPLSSETMMGESGPLQLDDMTPVRRIDIRAGKMSTVDWFDVNSVGSDSHYQFMNWSLDNEGAYDYAADTRGYTYGVELEYNDRNWAFRYGAMMMPKIANGLHLDADLARARGDNYEYELRPRALPNRVTVLRALAFVNHANMGSYREAINEYLAGQTPVPDITAVRQQGRVKYGFGFNGEQELTNSLRAFARVGWNDGHTESFAYTEIDQSFSGGADLRGTSWHRGDDKVGAAFVSNGISGDHREYLALGGVGFLLGDGRLNYARENIVEAYYNMKLWHGVWASLDAQRVWNPGYNQDRSPVFAGAVRLHLEAALFRSAR